MSKASKHVRAYLKARQRTVASTSILVEEEGGYVLTVADLEAVLQERADARAASKAWWKQFRQDTARLSAALGITANWDDLLGAARAMRAENSRLVQHNSELQSAHGAEVAERERLASQLAQAENQYRTLRQALREVTEAVLPAYKDRDAGQQLSVLQSSIEVERAQNADLRGYAQLDRELQAERSEHIHTKNTLSRERAGSRTSREAYNELIQEVRKTWQGNSMSRPGARSAGVQKISEARAYQLSKYGKSHDEQAGHRQQLMQAAQALLLDGSAIYPFGEMSWRGILRRGGRENQLAHAGACIAAVIDLLPPAKDEDEPGDFIDWSQE